MPSQPQNAPARIDPHGPVFILGCPRSGTTFLSDCLAAVPGVEEFVGILAPPKLMHLLGRTAPGAEREALTDAVNAIFCEAIFHRSTFRSERLAQLYQRNITVADFLRRPVLADQVLLYKEPFLCFAAEVFAEAFPPSKFIHIVRDGRDNADSLDRRYPLALSDEVLLSAELSASSQSEVGFWRRVNGFNFPWWVAPADEAAFRSLDKYGRCVWLWREMTVRARRVRAMLPAERRPDGLERPTLNAEWGRDGAERYLEIRYEDLVREPQLWGDRLLAFLGRPDSRLFRRKLGKAFQGSVRISKKNQSEARRAEAERIAGDLLRELGYAPG